ncbi:MAG: SPFH domain-containing protein [Gammaproteobacteria bacterium]
MFGINFIKSDPSTHLIQFKKGEAVRQGAGMSFYYFAPTTSLVAVPVTSKELPFAFRLQTEDFQKVTVQGQVTYRIANPEAVAKMLNFTIDGTGRYLSEDPQKLDERVLRSVQVLLRDNIQQQSLKASLGIAPELVGQLDMALQSNKALADLGVNIVDVSIVAVAPSPETEKALEAETREQLLKEADDAIYERRLASIDQEKRVKESELETEVAMQRKEQEIEETKIEAERAVMKKRYVLDEENMQAAIAEEEQRKNLVVLETANDQSKADTAAYGIEQKLKAYSSVPAEVLKALVMGNMGPEQLIAQAFENLTKDGNKVGNLNISPELLQSLIK